MRFELTRDYRAMWGKERAREIDEFSPTSSQRRAAKTREKLKKKRQAGNETSAVSQTSHDTTRSQSVFQYHNEMSEEEKGAQENGMGGQDDEDDTSNRAEDVIASLNFRPPSPPAGLADALTSTAAQPTDTSTSSQPIANEPSASATITTSQRPLPLSVNLRWAYEQLEHCLHSKKEPPTWLLNLVMQSRGGGGSCLENCANYDDKWSVLKSSIASLSSPMDNLKRGRNEKSNGNGRERSTTPARKPKSNSSNRNINKANSNRSSSNTNNVSTPVPAVDSTCNYPGCKYPDSHVRENCGLRKMHLKHGFEKNSR